jgi:hypothetical protein
LIVFPVLPQQELKSPFGSKQKFATKIVLREFSIPHHKTGAKTNNTTDDLMKVRSGFALC